MKLPQLESTEVLQLEQFFAEHFQNKVWRLGFYKNAKTGIEDAGTAAIKRLLRLLGGVKKSHKVLCLGAHSINLGLYLFEEYRCQVTVYCDEKLTTEKTYQKMLEEEYAEEITIDRGPSDILPYGATTFDSVVSLETLGLLADKENVLRRISSLLKPKGRMLFTSLFQQAASDQASYPGLHLIDADEYSFMARHTDLEQVMKLNLTEDMVRHYEELGSFIEKHKKAAVKELGQKLTKEFTVWLAAYADRLRDAKLGWGVFLFQKSNLQVPT